jgi:hypothetical protein
MYYPPVFINNFIKEKIIEFGAIDSITYFPTMPTTIDEIWETAQVNGSNQVVCIYDRLFRMRRSPFPHTKSEQLLHYMYIPSAGSSPLLRATAQLQDLLDGEDESAQAVNSWIRSKLNSNGKYEVAGEEFEPVFFHRIRVYQLEEVRDLVDFATARAVFANKMIIDYDWHKS